MCVCVWSTSSSGYYHLTIEVKPINWATPTSLFVKVVWLCLHDNEGILLVGCVQPTVLCTPGAASVGPHCKPSVSPSL